MANQCRSSKDISTTLGFKNNWHHDLWYDILDNEVIQDQNTGLLIKNTIGKINKSIIILAPRSHSKSTCFTVNYSLSEIVRNKNIRIIIVSNTADTAEAFLREIKSHIERTDNTKIMDFVRVFGNLMPQIPEKWTDRSIIINRPDLRLKDPTISAVGSGGSILSRRADIILMDDALNQDNSRTPEQREKIKEWFYNVLMPVLTPDGRLIVVGTIQDENDLYADLMQDKQFDIRLRMKAVVREDML